MKIVELDNKQIENLEASLEAYDEQYYNCPIEDRISLGIEENARCKYHTPRYL